jgi:hypothetical protein
VKPANKTEQSTEEQSAGKPPVSGIAHRNSAVDAGPSPKNAISQTRHLYGSASDGNMVARKQLTTVPFL